MIAPLARWRQWLGWIAIVWLLALCGLALVAYGSPQSHPTLEGRVRSVGLQLRCPACQGESVADSTSQLAQQMRGVIRQQLQSGKSEQEVIQYFRDSYGDQIVWSPPWQGFTLLAWLVPIGLLLAGIIMLFFVLRDWRALAPAGDAAPANIDEADLAFYRTQLEQELAADDPIFTPQSRTEAD